MRKIAWGLAAVLCLAMTVSAQDKKETDPDKARVTVDLQNVPLKKVIDHVKESTGIPVEYDDAVKKRVEDGGELVSIKVQDIAVTGFYQLLLLPRGLTVVVVDKKKIRISSAK